jgi:anti-anti-sigma factor
MLETTAPRKGFKMAITEIPRTAGASSRPAEGARTDAARTIVWLRGEHDLSTSAALWHTMTRAIEVAHNDLVVDLSDVEFMGAATVSVILRAAQLLRQESRSLTVRAPSRCARRVLDVCGLSGLVEADDLSRVGP